MGMATVLESSRSTSTRSLPLTTRGDRLAGERMRAGLLCDAFGRALAFCQVSREEARRIEQLWRQVRAQLQASAYEIPRAAVLRALLLKGLAPVEQRGFELAPLHSSPVRFEYLLTALDLEHLERFHEERWPLARRPSLERVHGTIIGLSLRRAEDTEDFAAEVASRRATRDAPVVRQAAKVPLQVRRRVR
jgi:hypothetical protein